MTTSTSTSLSATGRAMPIPPDTARRESQVHGGDCPQIPGYLPSAFACCCRFPPEKPMQLHPARTGQLGIEPHESESFAPYEVPKPQDTHSQHHASAPASAFGLNHRTLHLGRLSACNSQVCSSNPFAALGVGRQPHNLSVGSPSSVAEHSAVTGARIH